MGKWLNTLDGAFEIRMKGHQSIDNGELGNATHEDWDDACDNVIEPTAASSYLRGSRDGALGVIMVAGIMCIAHKVCTDIRERIKIKKEEKEESEKKSSGRYPWGS